MKVGKLFEHIMYGTMVATALYCAADCIKDARKDTKDFIENASQEIKRKDINRYTKIVDNITSGKVVNTEKMWAKEVKSMRDSLLIDSIAKTNYAKGAQMVRDSIKAAAKTFK